MTSDLTQHTETERARLPRAMRDAPAAAARESGTAARPQEHARHALEKDGWRRTMSAAMALLNKAYAMIEQAESLLAERDSHIRALETLTTIDALTGLLNRSGFFKAFRRETGRAARKASRGGLLILIDVDSFHAVNKLYGQEAGDTALRLIAHILKSEIRPMDVAARMGADEFVLLLADTDKEQALERAQRLALRLNNLSFIWHGAEVCVSASLGLKNYDENDSADSIFRAADRHLHINKEDKKNRMR